jgi:hypothetical protein
VWLSHSKQTRCNAVAAKNRHVPSGCWQNRTSHRCHICQGNDPWLHVPPCLARFCQATRLTHEMSTDPNTVPNANYWLGEFYLASTPPDFANAKRSFTMVMQQYPNSAKASAAIYRLATMAEVDDQLSEATRLMQLLTKSYGNTQEAGYAATFLKSHNVKSSSNTKPTEKTSKPANTPNTATPRKPSATPNTSAKPRTPAV